MEHLQFNGLVPVDYIARACKRFNVDHMDIAPLCTHIQPLTLEWEVTLRNSESKDFYRNILYLFTSFIHHQKSEQQEGINLILSYTQKKILKMLNN